MRVETTRFGWMDIEERELIHFPWGIPGFEELKYYVLLEHRDGPFQWLQATEEPSVAFVVCPPEMLGVEVQVPEEKTLPVQLESPDDLLVLNIVSFDRGKNTIRFHMRGPLVFNVAARLAYQWTLGPDEVLRYVRIPPNLSWSTDVP